MYLFGKRLIFSKNVPGFGLYFIKLNKKEKKVMKKVVKIVRESNTWTKMYYKLKSNGITYSYFMSSFDCEHPINNVITCSVFGFQFKIV